MIITLTDDEIRIALAEAMQKKLNHHILIEHPGDCWFEARAGGVNGEVVDSCKVSDIHCLKFCFDTNSGQPLIKTDLG